eukprot:5397372-Amphidinium_carterae.1
MLHSIQLCDKTRTRAKTNYDCFDDFDESRVLLLHIRPAHLKLLECIAKANNAAVLKPQLGKPGAFSCVSFTFSSWGLQPKSKME